MPIKKIFFNIFQIEPKANGFRVGIIIAITLPLSATISYMNAWA